MLTYPKNLEGSITIIGEKGTAKLGGVAVNNIEEWIFNAYAEEDKEVELSNYTPDNVYGYGHTGYYADVICVLLNDLEPKTSGKEGRKSLELICAIYESANTHKEIILSEV